MTDAPAIVPTIGRIVHYRLSAADADEIGRRRADFAAFGRRVNAVSIPAGETGRTGHMAHVGNRVVAGDVFPATIVRAWGDRPDSAVNLQVHLDGTDTYWATSCRVGDGDGAYAWPVRA